MGSRKAGWRRILGALLCLALALGVVPATAAAPRSAFEPVENGLFLSTQDGSTTYVYGVAPPPASSGSAGKYWVKDVLREQVQMILGYTYTVTNAPSIDTWLVSGMEFEAHDADGGDEQTGVFILFGDVTRNGEMDLSDLVYAASYLIDPAPASAVAIMSLDWNANGKIDVSDLVRQVDAYQGLVPMHPGEEGFPERLHVQAERDPDATPSPAPGASEAPAGPVSGTVLADQAVYDSQWATLEARVTGGTVSRVWFDVAGPDGRSEKVDASSRGGSWSAELSWFEKFEAPGTYTITGHAQDAAGCDTVLGSTTVDVRAEAVQGHVIMGPSQCTVEQLVNYQLGAYGWDNAWYRMTVEDFCRLYYDICAQEGVRAEFAYAQMCQETGGLRYGNLVVREQNNFAGLGASGNTVEESRRQSNHRYTEDGRDAGLALKTVEDGVKSHVQHLKAYASTEDLVLATAPEYDRFGYVERGCAPVAEKLVGTWAYGNPRYCEHVIAIVDDIMAESVQMPDYDHVIPPEPTPAPDVPAPNPTPAPSASPIAFALDRSPLHGE